MVDYNDPALVFEHAVRKHVHDAVAELDAFAYRHGEHNVTWSIEYRNGDEGQWHIHIPYRFPLNGATMKAAQLNDAVRNVKNAINDALAVKSLPALLASPVTEAVDE